MQEIPPSSKWQPRLRRGLIALAWIVSLIALCYGVTDWRGRRAWNDYRQDYEARVAPLDLRAYIPKPVPDSENFAATPFVQSWMKTGTNHDTNFVYDQDAFNKADNMVWDPPKDFAHARYEQKFKDLAAYQEAFAVVHTMAQNQWTAFTTKTATLLRALNRHPPC